MDLLTDYRISARMPSERELALQAERVRIARDRLPHAPRRTLRGLFARRSARTVTALTGPIATAQ